MVTMSSWDRERALAEQRNQFGFLIVPRRLLIVRKAFAADPEISTVVLEHDSEGFRLQIRGGDVEAVRDAFACFDQPVRVDPYEVAA